MTKNSDSRDIYQKTISKALERILHTDDIQEALTDVLQDVLKYFKAGRVAVMSTVKRNPGFQYCVMEVLAKGVSSSMSGREDSFPKHPWWYDKLEAGECVIVNDAKTQKWDDPSAYELLKSLGTRAHLGVPISRYSHISRFLAIDIIDRPYKWSKADIMWLKDLTNLMMLWRRLQKSRNEASMERSKLEKVLMTMPIGLCLYDKDGNISFANDRAMAVFGVKSFKDAKRFNIFKSALLSEDTKKRIREEEMVDASFEYNYGILPFEQNVIKQEHDVMRINIMARYSKIYDPYGEVKAYLVAYMDKTREQNNSQKIHELDEIISLTADFAQLGYSRINVIDNTGYATKQWYKNNNMSFDDSSKGIADFVDILHPDDRLVSDDFRNAVRQGKNVRLNRRMRIRRPGKPDEVLINFASNAAKFTDKGHIIIGYHFTTPDRIRFFVEDTGIGIPEDKKAKIFERFVKLNTFVQGTGLGLQISKEIVTCLGGIIGVESEPGEGSMFWFEIPVKNGVKVTVK